MKNSETKQSSPCVPNPTHRLRELSEGESLTIMKPYQEVTKLN